VFRKTPHASLLRLAAIILVLLACVLIFVPASAAQHTTFVIVIPATVSVRVPGGMQQFDARVKTAHQNHSVHWTLTGPGCRGAACGTLSETTSTSGSAITYTAPAKLPNPPTITLTATSDASGFAKAHASVTLTSDAAVVFTTASVFSNRDGLPANDATPRPLSKLP